MRIAPSLGSVDPLQYGELLHNVHCVALYATPKVNTCGSHLMEYSRMCAIVPLRLNGEVLAFVFFSLVLFMLSSFALPFAVCFPSIPVNCKQLSASIRFQLPVTLDQCVDKTEQYHHHRHRHSHRLDLSIIRIRKK